MRISDWSSDVCSSDLTPYSDRRIHLITCRTRIAIAVFVTIATLLLGFGISRGFASSFDTKLSLLLALRAGEDSNALIVFMQGVSWLGGGVPRWTLALLLAVLLWRSAGRAGARTSELQSLMRISYA